MLRIELYSVERLLVWMNMCARSSPIQTTSVCAMHALECLNEWLPIISIMNGSRMDGEREWMVLDEWSSRTSGWQNLPLPTSDGQLSVLVAHSPDWDLGKQDVREREWDIKCENERWSERLRCIGARRATGGPWDRTKGAYTMSSDADRYNLPFLE